jgi:Ion channel
MRDDLPLARLWTTDRGFPVLLGALVALIFVLPAIRYRPETALFVQILFTLVFVSGLTATANSRVARITGIIVFGAAIALHWVDYFVPRAGLWLPTALGRLVAIVLVTVLVTRHVLRREGSITIRRIQGAVAVYLLLGLTWAGVYEIIHGVWPGAFRFSEPVPETRIDFATSLAYYSFVTLTTMGYGDITPLHPVARSAAILEALVGQLFPAILIARLVAMELAARERR